MMPRASRAASHSVSLSTWRQWSKHSANNSDCDSILSEPASYSSSARVSNDIWIVQNDVGDGKPLYRPRQCDRVNGREYHSANLRRPMLKTRVAPPAYDAYNDDTNSSKLLSEFFSGCISPTLAPNNKRAMSEFDRRQQATRDTTRGFGGSGSAYYASARDQQRQQFASYKQANMHSFCGNEPYVEKKRFSARRLRWWLRKWTQKMRGQWEYNF
ncbi:hypothetical protein FGB62_68g128 [Gracilaria domingensis]|nr:hypothetical protein FGB62_68g128 [Gracilaria domingensis]